MFNAKYACNSPEHLIARRQFLGAVAAAGAGACVGNLGIFAKPAIAEQLQSAQKRIVIFNMHGGLSQLESWDPKPGAATGGRACSEAGSSGAGVSMALADGGG